MTRQIDYLPLAELKPDPKNPKDHDVGLIHTSVGRFGFVEPIVLDGRTGLIVSGHGRVKALEALEAEGGTPPEGVTLDGDGRWLAPVAVGWESSNDTEAAAALIAMNRTTEMGGWVDESLLELLEQIGNLDGVGYDAEDIADLQQRVGVPTAKNDPDDAPPLDEKSDPITRAGDVWYLGPHRLLCGDATDLDSVGRMLAGDRPDCVWTDPPYGVSYEGGTPERLTIDNDEAADLDWLLPGAFEVMVNVCQPGAPVYVAHADITRSVFERHLRDSGVLIRQGLVWVKNAMVLSHSDYHYRHEPILHGEISDEGGKEHTPILYGFGPGGEGRLGRGGARWYGNNSRTTVFEYPKPPRSAEHPTMKPVALIAAQLRNSVRPGGLVFDMFAGSGSTLIAAHTLSLIAALVELSPRYCDVICRRYQEHTGTVPIRDGEPVDFIEAG